MSNTSEILDKDRIIKKFRFIFKKISWKKNLTFLFFLLLAIIFWGMQVYSQKIEIKLAIPIKYTNVASNILFEHELPQKIDVDVSDYGSAVFKYSARSNDTLEIDLGAIIKESATKRTIQGQAYEQLVRSKLLSSSELLSFSPTYISYAYSRVAVRKLPVLFDGVTHLSPGYQLDGDIIIYPDSVVAYGSSAALDTLRFAYTVKDTIQNVKESKRIDVMLRETKGVEFKPSKIKLDIPVDQFIVKELKVPVECINLPENLTIKFFPSEVSVSFFVGLKRYNLIESSNFKILVDYSSIKDLGNKSVPIRIIESPDFVRTRLPEPSEVEFILEKK